MKIFIKHEVKMKSIPHTYRPSMFKGLGSFPNSGEKSQTHKISDYLYKIYNKNFRAGEMTRLVKSWAQQCVPASLGWQGGDWRTLGLADHPDDLTR